MKWQGVAGQQRQDFYYDASGTITSGGPITLGTNAYLALQQAPSYIVPNLSLLAGSTLVHLPNSSAKASWLDLQVTTFTVAAGFCHFVIGLFTATHLVRVLHFSNDFHGDLVPRLAFFPGEH